MSNSCGFDPPPLRTLIDAELVARLRLVPLLGTDVDLVIRGEGLPALAEALALFVTDADVWHRNGRSVCVGLGQWDKEFPIQLVLAVGELELD